MILGRERPLESCKDGLESGRLTGKEVSTGPEEDEEELGDVAMLSASASASASTYASGESGIAASSVTSVSASDETRMESVLTEMEQWGGESKAGHLAAQNVDNSVTSAKDTSEERRAPDGKAKVSLKRAIEQLDTDETKELPKVGVHRCCGISHVLTQSVQATRRKLAPKSEAKRARAPLVKNGLVERYYLRSSQ